MCCHRPHTNRASMPPSFARLGRCLRQHSRSICCALVRPTAWRPTISPLPFEQDSVTAQCAREARRKHHAPRACTPLRRFGRDSLPDLGAVRLHGADGRTWMPPPRRGESTPPRPRCALEIELYQQLPRASRALWRARGLGSARWEGAVAAPGRAKLEATLNSHSAWVLAAPRLRPARQRA